jgi:CxxC motif-containing protein (DUF1111 family)
MKLRGSCVFARLAAAILLLGAGAAAPGARRADFGDPLDGLSPSQRELFQTGLEAFSEEEDAADGLGPIFNDVSCAACHSAPDIGGGSGINETRAARLNGRTYVELPGGSLFQSSAISPSCAETVPANANVVASRQSTPLFGLGLVEAIPDVQIEIYRAFQSRAFPGQAGRVNHVVDVARGGFRAGRFGWKAQQATLLAFAGDAYVNEMGVTSRLFRNENAPNGDRQKLKACDEVPDPEDTENDIDRFADFMRLLAPPPRDERRFAPGGFGASRAGQRVFARIGCAVCHANPYFTSSSIAAIHGRKVAAYSDFLLHDVGTGDGIEQGQARGNEFRTPPLWGISKSAPYLHDGSAATIPEAILKHANQGASAASQFGSLSPVDQQALLAFLGSI